MSPLMQPGQEPPNKGRKYPAEVLTAGEVQALIGACSARSASGIRNRALIALLYRSGLRVSEIVALRPADVDLRRHSVRVLHGKGDKATTRGFHPSCDDALARWTDTRKALGIRGGHAVLHPPRRRHLRPVRQERPAPPRPPGRTGKAGTPARPQAHVCRRAGTRRGTGQPDIQAARALLDRGYEPVPGPPEQRRGDRGPGGGRAARPRRLGRAQCSMTSGGPATLTT
jgi:integrase